MAQVEIKLKTNFMITASFHVLHGETLEIVHGTMSELSQWNTYIQTFPALP